MEVKRRVYIFLAGWIHPITFQDCQKSVHRQLLVCEVNDEEVTKKSPHGAKKRQFQLTHLICPQQETILTPRFLWWDPSVYGSCPDINTSQLEDAPVQERSYRIPEWLVPVLQKVDVSSSEWCSSIDVVPKKDAEIFIEFRYLNSMSDFDPCFTPRIDDLLGKTSWT